MEVAAEVLDGWAESGAVGTLREKLRGKSYIDKEQRDKLDSAIENRVTDHLRARLFNKLNEICNYPKTEEREKLSASMLRLAVARVRNNLSLPPEKFEAELQGYIKGLNSEDRILEAREHLGYIVRKSPDAGLDPEVAKAFQAVLGQFREMLGQREREAIDQARSQPPRQLDDKDYQR